MPFDDFNGAWWRQMPRREPPSAPVWTFYTFLGFCTLAALAIIAGVAAALLRVI